MNTIKTWNDLRALTVETLEQWSTDDLCTLETRLGDGMDMCWYGVITDPEQKKLVDKWYWAISAIIQDRYYRENVDDLWEYFNTHLKGHTWEEVKTDAELMECYNFFSDYHKDVYGHRPRGLFD